MNRVMDALKEEVSFRKIMLEQLVLTGEITSEVQATLLKSLEGEVQEVLDDALTEFFTELQEKYAANLNEDQQREILRRASATQNKTDFQGVEESYISYAAILAKESE